MSVPPLPPAASQRPSASPLARFGGLVAALGCLLLVEGCYEGPSYTGVAWDGNGGDTDGEAMGSDGGADGSGGAADGGAAGDGGAVDGGAADDSGAADDGPAGGDAGTGGPAGDGGSADGGSADGGATDGGDPPPPADEVPDNAYCDEVAAWDPAWSQLEVEILDIVNLVRSQGANCGSAGSFGPTGPLTMHPALRCAARKHSKDMADRGFFDHTNPDGESPWDRMGQAGYSYSAAGENIAGGNATASATMDQWMNSDGHCANIMNPDFTEIGVGYYPGGQWGYLWTQAFGSP